MFEALTNPYLSSFVDGFILPFALVARVSGWLDGIGRRIADWLVP